MIEEFKSVIDRNRTSLAADVIGISALVVTLLVGLHLPGVF